MGAERPPGDAGLPRRGRDFQNPENVFVEFIMKISKLGALGAPALLSFEATGSMLEVPTQCSGFLFSDGLFPSGFGPSSRTSRFWLEIRPASARVQRQRNVFGGSFFSAVIVQLRSQRSDYLSFLFDRRPRL